MDRSRHHQQQSNSREELVDKLHGTLSILRRERDELHRAKQLAVERLHLIEEERSTAESNLHTLQQKYDSIVSSHQRDERRNEIVKLQSEVERLGREAKFQHMELVGKREKMNALKSKMQEEEIQYSKHLRTAKEALRIRREKVSARQANHVSASVASDSTSTSASMSTSASDAEKMKQMLADNSNSRNNIDFFLKIQRMVEKKTDDLEDETNLLSAEIEAVKRRVNGYENYIQRDCDCSGMIWMDAYAQHQHHVLALQQ